MTSYNSLNIPKLIRNVFDFFNQILDIEQINLQEIEDHLDETIHLCNYDGSIATIIENKYHYDLLNLMKINQSEIQRKILNILLKIVKNYDQFLEAFVSDIVSEICNILKHGNNRLTQENGVTFISDILKERRNCILETKSQRILLDCIIFSIEWNNTNILYHSLFIMNILPDHDGMIAKFLINNMGNLGLKLKPGPVNEKLGILICNLLLKSMVVFEINEFLSKVISNNFDEVLMKIIFHSYLTISSEYYLVVIQLLCKILMFNFSSEQSSSENSVDYVSEIIQRNQSIIVQFLLENLKRYNVKEISINGLKLLNLILTNSTNLRNILNETNQESWIDFILDVLRNNLTSSDIIICAFKVLYRILILNQQLIGFFESRICLNDLAIETMIIQVLYTQSTLTPDSFCASCRLLSVLSMYSEKMQNRFLESRIHTIIHMMIIRFFQTKDFDYTTQFEIRMATGNALRSLVMFNIPAKELFFNEDRQYEETKRFLMNIGIHKHDCESFKEPVACYVLFLASLVQYNPIKYDLLQGKMFDLRFLLCCNVCSKNANVIEAIQELLIVLSGNEAETEFLLNILSIEKWLDISTEFSKTYAIQKNTLIFLQLNCSKISAPKQPLIISRIVNMISKATLLFPDSLVMKAEACVLIQIIIKKYPDYIKTFIDNNLEIFLFETMTDNQNEELVKIALQAFHAMITFTQIKETIVMKAVKEANLMLLQCMIAVGSDLNNISKDILLVAVRHKRQSISGVMTSCLLNNGCRPDTYIINTCLEINNIGAAGFLLQFYGIHESDRGHIINWSSIGMKHFHIHWITKLSQEVDIEIDKQMKRLGQRIELESRKRFILKNRYESQLVALEKLTRYPLTQMRTLEKSIGGYKYYTLRNNRIPEKIGNDDLKDNHFNYSLDDFGKNKLDMAFSLKISNTKSTKFQSETYLETGTYNPNKNRNEKKYKPIMGEINEFLNGFRCGTDYSYHQLDPRCLLSERTRSRRDYLFSYGLDEINLDYYFKIPNSKIPNKPKTSRTNDDSFSWDKNSESKCNISQISSLDLSKNKLNNIEEFKNISQDIKLVQMFKGITSIKLERNSLKTIPVNAFSVMDSLEKIDLSDNDLTDIPWDIFRTCPLVRLDLSRNKLTKFHLSDEEKETLKSFGKCHNLLYLYLSGNKFNTFNVSSLGLFINLQSIELNSINVDIAGNEILPLPNLTKIVMKCNSKSSINENFLKFSQNISHINFSENKLNLTSNPLKINLNFFENLVSVDLSNNNLAYEKPYFIPKSILKIPRLTNLNMSYNNIIEFPPCGMWTSTELRDLNFSHNLIEKLNLLHAEVNFQNLQMLDLSHNYLRKIPAEIGCLNKLTFLNISHNPNLKELPDEIGLLKNKNLNSLIREGITLNLPTYISKNAQLRDVLKFYYNRLRQSVEYKGIKLMVLGCKGRGKTSLLYALQGKKLSRNQNSQSNGIEVSNWRLINKSIDKTSDYKVTSWDFTGQEILLCSHKCFLSQRALVLLVFNVTKNVEEIRLLKPWLSTLKSQTPNAPLIIVGTHLDEVKDSKEKYCLSVRNNIIKLCQIPGFSKVSDIVFVDSRFPNEGINELKSKIFLVLNNHQVQHELMIEKQPLSYIKLEEALQNVLKTLPPSYPIITEKELRALITKNKIDLQGEDLNQAIQFLHDNGALIHFCDLTPKLNNLYLLKPEWVYKMIGKILALKGLSPFIHDGIIKEEDFFQITKSFFTTSNLCLPNDVTADNYTFQCMQILKKFDVIFQHSSAQLIIPSKLPASRPHLKIPKNVPKIVRIFECVFLPTGFWPRLITRISALSQGFDQFFNVCKVNLELWKTGVFISLEDSVYLLLEGKHQNEYDKEIIEILVIMSELGIKIFVQIIDCIEVLIEEWYPGLADSDMNGNKIITRLARCPNCESLINLMEIEQVSKESDQISCKQCTSIYGNINKYQIRIIAPDIILGDLPNDLLINPDLLEVNKCPENLIGSGGIGSVYKGTYMGKDCAVKYITHFENSCDPPSYRLLRQEIDILRRIRHPSLINFLSVDRERIVLELAPFGDLKFILSHHILPKKMLQRIAYQVISGIEYLHANNIIYRDLKIQNVLVFSYEFSVHINVKLADYGIARSLAPFSFVNPQGTFGYQAPEVIKRSSSYELSADIYSFGIVLFNIATRGHHPADFKSHWRPGMQSELIPSNKFDTWPRMQDCINSCTKLNPEDRPNAAELSKFISCPSFIGVKCVWPLTKQTRIECMTTVTCEDNSLKVILANGNQFKQELRCLDITSGQSKGKPLVTEKNPNNILCMALCMDNILLGTEKGELYVYDYLDNKVSPLSISFEDSILSMILANVSAVDSKILLLGLANGKIYFKNRFKTTPEVGKTLNFKNIQLSNAPVTNIHIINDTIFATSGSGVYKMMFKNKKELEQLTILRPKENDHSRLIKCFFPITENMNDVPVSFYFTYRNESIIYYYDEEGNQLRPKFDCQELMKSRIRNDRMESFKNRIMCLYVWSCNRYLAVGTGSGYIIIIDQKTEYSKVLGLFENPVLCISHVKFPIYKKAENQANNSTENPMSNTMTNSDKFLKMSKIKSGLLFVGNRYKSIGLENVDGSSLILLSDDISNISRQLENHIELRNNIL